MSPLLLCIYFLFLSYWRYQTVVYIMWLCHNLALKWNIYSCKVHTIRAENTMVCVSMNTQFPNNSCILYSRNFTFWRQTKDSSDWFNSLIILWHHKRKYAYLIRQTFDFFFFFCPFPPPHGFRELIHKLPRNGNSPVNSSQRKCFAPVTNAFCSN